MTLKKPCGTSFGHDGCGYVFIIKGDKKEVPLVEKEKDDKSSLSSAKIKGTLNGDEALTDGFR